MASVVRVIRPDWGSGFGVVGVGVGAPWACECFDHLTSSGRPVVADTVVVRFNLLICLSPLISCHLSKLFSCGH